MATFKNEVLVRVYIVVFAVVLVGVAIFAKAVRISMVEGKFWRDKIENQYFQMRKVEAGRGNILASNGGLLATSLPYFELAFDPNSSGMTDVDFDLNIDSLAYCLATYVDQSFTPEGMRDYLIEMRKAKKLVKGVLFTNRLQRIIFGKDLFLLIVYRMLIIQSRHL
jgi:cell division protein FtsI (penicillin-binding protein 3)